MKRKTQISNMFTHAFAVLSILLTSAYLLPAQCGNYFNIGYGGINKLRIQSGSTPLRLDDWTGDGKSDFWEFQATGAGSGVNVVIFPSKPTGYWDWDNPIVYSTTILNTNADYKIADIDSDGKKDLISGFFNSFQFHRNNGNGSLIPHSQVSENTTVYHLGFVDINGDNLLDWVYKEVLNNPSRTVLNHLRQNPNGSFSNKTVIATSTAENNLHNAQIEFGDFTGDGKIDILYVYFTNGRGYALITNLGNGNFEVGTPVLSPSISLITAVRDFNNDGKGDFLSGTGVFYGQADGTFSRTQLPGVNTPLAPAELNGDNFLDIIHVTSGSYTTLINNGAGDFTPTVYPKNLASDLNGLKFEDFNADGKDDFFDNRPFTFSFNIFRESLIVVQENICQPHGATKSANFDNNTNTDVMTWNPNNGNWSSKNAIWGSGADTTTKDFQWGSGALGDVPAPGDFDGDGKTDYAVYRNSTGVWYIFRSSDSTWQTFQFGITDDIAVPNDYDGGGKTDIAVFRPSEGNWYIWFSETQQFLGLHFGLNGDKPVPADFDGDGETDVAVFRPSTGVWYYLKSSNEDFVAVQWGVETDIPVPADYDGDGRADLTVYRNGIWWILRSSSNSYTAIEWGNAGDIPLPVYRNSVSADMTLYRPSNNSWYSFDFRYNAGISTGGNPDVPVYFGLPNN